MPLISALSKFRMITFLPKMLPYVEDGRRCCIQFLFFSNRLHVYGGNRIRLCGLVAQLEECPACYIYFRRNLETYLYNKEKYKDSTLHPKVHLTELVNCLNGNLQQKQYFQLM